MGQSATALSVFGWGMEGGGDGGPEVMRGNLLAEEGV